jgi:hypothetical protein
MSAVARSTEKDEPLDIIGAATLLNDYWDLRLFLADENFVPRFKTDVHWVVLPLSKIFASVYRKCRDLLLYDTLRQTRKRRRARS